MAMSSSGFVSAGGAMLLNDLTDTDVPSPSDGQALIFNTGTGNWEAAFVSTICDGDGDTCFSIDADGSDSDVASVTAGGLEIMRWFNDDSGSGNANIFSNIPTGQGTRRVIFDMGGALDPIPQPQPFGVGNGTTAEGHHQYYGGALGGDGNDQSGLAYGEGTVVLYEGNPAITNDVRSVTMIADQLRLNSFRSGVGGENTQIVLRQEGIQIQPGDGSNGNQYRNLMTHPSKWGTNGVCTWRRPIQAEQYTRVITQQTITGTPALPQTLNMGGEIQGPSNYATTHWMNVVGGNNFEITDVGRYKYAYNLNLEAIAAPVGYNEFKIYLWNTKTNTVYLDSTSYVTISPNQLKCSVSWTVLQNNAPVSQQPNIELRIEQTAGTDSIQTMDTLGSGDASGGKFIIDKLCGQ